MGITIESIAAKLGFDPMNPPTPDVDQYSIDDNTPSIWSPLTKEELAFLLKMWFGDKFVP